MYNYNVRPNWHPGNPSRSILTLNCSLQQPLTRGRKTSHIMPPHLHPRSRMTSSLFASTVVACFFVVALPHMLPCPVPANRFADGDVVVDENGRRKRFRKREEPKNGIVQFGSDVEADEGAKNMKRECPVPKPGGMLGEWLGFHKDGQEPSNRLDR